MKKYFSLSSVVFVLVFIVFIIGVTAFSQDARENKGSFRSPSTFRNDDSTSPRRSVRGHSLGFEKLDQEMMQLEAEMKKLDVEMKKLDVELKKIDFSAIKSQVDESLKNIDWEKIKKDIEESVAKVDKVHIAEVQKQIEKVRKEVVQEKIGHPRLPDMEKIRKEIDESNRERRESLRVADEEIKGIRTLTDALKKDGLLDKTKTNRIELKDGELYINGTKQSKEVNEKYKHLFNKKTFTIIQSEGDDRI